MRLLLDTHVFVWWMLADRRLTKRAREILMAPDHDIVVSAASYWEIEIKRGLERVGLDYVRLESNVKADRFEELPIRISHTGHLQVLPLRHRDPFDRILMAQAIAEQRVLVTADRLIRAYEDVPGLTLLPV